MFRRTNHVQEKQNGRVTNLNSIPKCCCPISYLLCNFYNQADSQEQTWLLMKTLVPQFPLAIKQSYHLLMYINKLTEDNLGQLRYLQTCSCSYLICVCLCCAGSGIW